MEDEAAAVLLASLLGMTAGLLLALWLQLADWPRGPVPAPAPRKARRKQRCCPCAGARGDDAPSRPRLALPEGIEDLCLEREELNKQIQQEEEEKIKVQNDIRILTKKLARVNETLAHKLAPQNELDKITAETEAAYLKILESSQTLLTALKKEAGNLSKIRDKTPVTEETLGLECP